ncbi:hypothetical protein [Sphingomonas canadensis]|uniref:hypothetical protein n=1 Tax=Sphingomonas canadensis TaxID=1219257 RepID=UPI0022300270|nr:hypothetical protein [Sphingomonas canadensis]
MNGGLHIAPLGYQQIDKLTRLEPGRYSEGFKSFSEGLQAALLKAVDGGTLAFVETNYFGGTGSQAAAVIAGGKVAMQAATAVTRNPVRRDDPINSALRALGVEAASGMDEFDTVGLGRFRDLESLGLDEWDDE